MLKFLASAAAVGYAAKKGYSKDLGKGLGIAGALFFASGLGVAGFNAFQGKSTLSGFLGAVGQTTLAGAQGLMGSVGIGGGVSPRLAGSLGVTAGSTLFGGGSSVGGFGSSMMGSAMSGFDQMYSAGQTGTASSNVLDNFYGGINTSSAIKSAQNRSILMSAIQGGAQMYLANRQFKKEEKMRARLNFYGGPARGGSAELPFDVPSVMSKQSNKNPSDTVGAPVTPSPFDDNDDKDQSDAPGFMRGLI